MRLPHVLCGRDFVTEHSSEPTDSAMILPRNLYLVDEDLHNTLVSQRANVTFKIGNDISRNQTVDIDSTIF